MISFVINAPTSLHKLLIGTSYDYDVDNRLDKNTSGAMVLGRTDFAVRELSLLFKQNKIEKNVSPLPILN